MPYGTLGNLRGGTRVCHMARSDGKGLRLEWIVEHLNSDVKGEGDIRLFTVSQFAYCTSTSRDI